jgi:hypothetical protein
MLAYIIGSLLVAGALGYAAITLLGFPPVWVGIACVVIIGLGIMGAATTTPSRRVTTTTNTAGGPAPGQVSVTRED